MRTERDKRIVALASATITSIFVCTMVKIILSGFLVFEWVMLIFFIVGVLMDMEGKGMGFKDWLKNEYFAMFVIGAVVSITLFISSFFGNFIGEQIIVIIASFIVGDIIFVYVKPAKNKKVIQNPITKLWMNSGYSYLFFYFVVLLSGVLGGVVAFYLPNALGSYLNKPLADLAIGYVLVFIILLDIHYIHD